MILNTIFQKLGFRKQISDIPYKQELLDKILFLTKYEKAVNLLFFCKQNLYLDACDNHFWSTNYQRIGDLGYNNKDCEEVMTDFENLAISQFYNEYESYIGREKGSRDIGDIASEMQKLEKLDTSLFRDMMVEFIVNRFVEIHDGLNKISEDLDSSDNDYVIGKITVNFFVGALYIGIINTPQNRLHADFINVYSACIDQYLILMTKFSALHLLLEGKKKVKDPDLALQDISFLDSDAFQDKIQKIGLDNQEAAKNAENGLELIRFYNIQSDKSESNLLLLERFLIKSSIDGDIRVRKIKEFFKTQ